MNLFKKASTIFISLMLFSCSDSASKGVTTKASTSPQNIDDGSVRGTPDINLNPDDNQNPVYINGTVIPAYSKQCNDFDFKGWSSKLDCLQDGRWHHVFSNKGDDITYGVLNDFVQLIEDGAEVRVKFAPDNPWGIGASGDLCISTAFKSGKLLCMTTVRSGSSGTWESGGISNNYSLGYWTNGQLWYNATNNTNGSLLVSNGQFDWYIRF